MVAASRRAGDKKGQYFGGLLTIAVHLVELISFERGPCLIMAIL